jgi:hypothetical protein
MSGSARSQIPRANQFHEIPAVVKFPILQDPAVKYWFGGIEPVWTLLNETSFASLSRPPSPLTGPIRLTT